MKNKKEPDFYEALKRTQQQAKMEQQKRLKALSKFIKSTIKKEDK